MRSRDAIAIVRKQKANAERRREESTDEFMHRFWDGAANGLALALADLKAEAATIAYVKSRARARNAENGESVKVRCVRVGAQDG